VGNERAVLLTWLGQGMQFSGAGTEPATSTVVIDGDAVGGPSPMLLLLLAAGACTGSDVVSILAKMRVRLRRCEIEVSGTRRTEDPRRFLALHLRFTLAGEKLDRAKAERAVSLSLATYCSVVHSLAPDIAIDHEIALA
jgi:putative redox protein